MLSCYLNRLSISSHCLQSRTSFLVWNLKGEYFTNSLISISEILLQRVISILSAAAKIHKIPLIRVFRDIGIPELWSKKTGQ